MSVTPTQRGFRLDTNLCTGCGACAVACAVENELPWGTSWRWIETFNERHVPGLPSYHLSLACNHCADAPCKEQCPALAYAKDVVTGAVLLDPDKCIGCRYCTWACPYDAPRFDADRGVVSKCTFCHQRQLEGLAPACVQQCPTGALTFGALGDLDGEASVPGFPETPARPSVRFVPFRGSEALEGIGVATTPAPVPPTSPPKTSLVTEGPLVGFTLLVSALAGVMATSAGRARIELPLFLALAAAAGGASLLHLGRKERAWRALLNVRRSWLSREVALFTAFVAVGAAWLSPLPTPGWGGGLAAALGFALLFAVDRVYGVTKTRGLATHSAGVLLTGILVAGVASGSAVVWGTALTAKIVSYTVRKARFAEAQRPVRGLWTGVRLGSALMASSLLILAAPLGVVVNGTLALAGLIALGVGETVDRCEFYLELEVGTPRGAMAEALNAARHPEVREG